MDSIGSVELIPLACGILVDAGYFPVQALDEDLVAEDSETAMDIRWQLIKPPGDNERHGLLRGSAFDTTLSAHLRRGNSEL